MSCIHVYRNSRNLVNVLQVAIGNSSTNQWTVPLEVKTGKLFNKMGTPEHRAQVCIIITCIIIIVWSHDCQVMLYCLMLSDMYQTSMPAGLLYYMKDNHTHLVPSATNEIKGSFEVVYSFSMVIFCVIFSFTSSQKSLGSLPW